MSDVSEEKKKNWWWIMYHGKWELEEKIKFFFLFPFIIFLTYIHFELSLLKNFKSHIGNLHIEISTQVSESVRKVDHVLNFLTRIDQVFESVRECWTRVGVSDTTRWYENFWRVSVLSRSIVNCVPAWLHHRP